MRPVAGTGVVHSPVAPLFDEPRVSSVQISQLLAGHPVELLEARDGWWCVRGVDRYEGWMHRGFLHARDGGEGAPRARERLSLGCTVDRGGMRRALPLRALLEPDDRLVGGEIIDVAEQARLFPRDAAAITRSARRYFEGTSYLWGGVTPWGADCSGLVQSTFALHGVPLPRDAWQQASAGVPADVDPLTAREGDLLFFSDRVDRHITHVAIALGARAIVHLALGRGGYGIEHLDDATDPYVATLLERFACARRVL
ncbi:MAG TPA: SH3 domain-containing C40 family peptidase [Gemmatimonadaceae bacterium]|nr:SH3 domain-containing C40 family peptidase [Gemmatimonadaceae bacterium]